MMMMIMMMIDKFFGNTRSKFDVIVFEL